MQPWLYRISNSCRVAGKVSSDLSCTFAWRNSRRYLFIFLVYQYTTGCQFGDKNKWAATGVGWRCGAQPISSSKCRNRSLKDGTSIAGIIFPHNVLASGCVTQPCKSGIVKLDQEKVHAIWGEHMKDKGFNTALVLAAIVLMWYVINNVIYLLQFMSTIGSMWESSIHLKKQVTEGNQKGEVEP